MKPLHLDLRTKLALLFLCVLSAILTPNLYARFALVALLGLLAVLNGKWRYALRGILVYGLICAFTVWCMGFLTGTWRMMFVAFLGLVHKVYACGILAGSVISTTKVGEFLSAMVRLHIPKKLTISIAVMLRYLPTIREDWYSIRDAMLLRDVSPTFWGFLKAPAMTVNCIYVPLLTVLPIGGLLLKNGALTPEKFALIVILSMGLITPIIGCMKFTDDLAKVGTIIGQVTNILTAPELPRPAADAETPRGSKERVSPFGFPKGDTL